MSLGASNIGNCTLLRVRVPVYQILNGALTLGPKMKRHEFKLETHLLKGSPHPTQYHHACGGDYIVGEILKGFCAMTIEELMSMECPPEHMWTSSVGEAYSEPVRIEARKRGITFIDDVLTSVFSQKIGAKQILKEQLRWLCQKEGHSLTWRIS